MRYQILGQLEVGGRAVASPQERRLLAVLLLRRNSVVPVGTAAGAVWGNDVPASAKVSLQSKITRLRKLVAPSLIEFGSGGYRLEVGDGECDADRFEQLAERLAGGEAIPDEQRLSLIEEALGLWRGELLGDMVNDDFVEGEAVRLERRRNVVAEDHAETLLALDRADAALAVLDTLLPDDPYNERLCGLQMEVLARKGRSVDAVRFYDAFRRRLGEDTGMVPSAALVALERRLLAEPTDPRLASPQSATAGGGASDNRLSGIGLGGPGPGQWNNDIVSRPEFVARESQLATIRRVLSNETGPRAVVLLGDGGIGKTRLVVETLGMSRAAGRPSRMIRCTPQPAPLFGPLVHYEQPENTDWTSGAARDQAVASYARAVRSSLEPGSVVVVEDLHWADDGTLDVIDSVLTSVLNDDLDVVFVLTSRPVPDDAPATTWLARFTRSVASTTLELQGLNEPEVFKLIERACRNRPDINLSDLVHNRTAGNPLLALTGLRSLHSQGALRFDGDRIGTSTAAFTAMPPDLARSLDQILANLSPPTLQLLAEVSASPSPPNVGDLPVAQQQPTVELDAAVEQAERAGLLVRADRRLQISHELFARVIVDRLAAGERTELHHRLFRHHLDRHHLDRQGGSAGDRPPGDAHSADIPAGEIESALESADDAVVLALAHHGEWSGQAIDDAARFAVFREAGRRALAATDWSRAARFHRLAQSLVEQVDLSDERLLELHCYTGMALFRNHDAEEALPLLDQVIDEAERLGQTTLWGLALADHHRALFTLTHDVPRPNNARVDRFVRASQDDQPAQCARLLALSAEHHFSFGDNQTAAGLAEDAEQLAKRLQDDLLQSELDFAAGLVALGDFSLGPAADKFRSSFTAASTGPWLWTASWGIGRLGFVQLLEGDFAAATASTQRARTTQLTASSWAELSFTAAMEAQLAFARGDAATLGEAVDEAERLVQRTAYAFTAQWIYPLLLQQAFVVGDIEAYDQVLQRWVELPARAPRVFTTMRSAMEPDRSPVDTVGELRLFGSRPLGPGHLPRISAHCELARLTADEALVTDTIATVERLELEGLGYLPGQRQPPTRLRQDLEGLLSQ